MITSVFYDIKDIINHYNHEWFFGGSVSQDSSDSRHNDDLSMVDFHGLWPCLRDRCLIPRQVGYGGLEKWVDFEYVPVQLVLQFEHIGT